MKWNLLETIIYQSYQQVAQVSHLAKFLDSNSTLLFLLSFPTQL